MASGSRATHGAAGVVGLRARRLAGAGPSGVLALLLGLAATPACDDCRGTSFDPNVCRSDLDCDPAEVCSPGGVCAPGAGECAETAACPRLAPERCEEGGADVVCRGGACRYDLACLKLGGSVHGLVGRGLVLGNGAERVQVDLDAPFEFDALYRHGDSYNVVIAQQPKNPGQVCIVGDGDGRFNVSDVATVRVTCAFLPEDQDGDRICDGETLSDACVNILDNCLGLSNPDQSDRDLDGLGDLCDPCTDRDQDGFGRAGLDQTGCPQPGDDCDDEQDDAHPGLTERCGDAVDNDCDGLTDELGCQKPYVAPVARADAYTIDEDATSVDLDVLANDTVWDDPTVRVTITGTTAPSANGSLVVAPGGARLRYTPRADHHGDERFAYSITDGVGGVSSATVTVTLRPVNDPPTAGPDAFVIPEDSPVTTLDILANDSSLPDGGEPLSVPALGQPSAGGSASLLLGGNVQYRPKADFNGVETLSYILSDGKPGSTAVGHITLTITAVNDPPKLHASLPDQVIDEDIPWSFALPAATFLDVDAGDLLTLTAALASGDPLPGWLSFDPATRVFAGTPGNPHVGSLLVEVRATDLASSWASDVFTLTVVNVNDPPTLAVPLSPQLAVEGAPFSFTVPAATFADIDADDTLTTRATRADGTPLPAWLTYDRATRLFTGTPQNADVGTFNLVVVATDRAGASASAPFLLTVRNVNQPPTLARPVADLDATEDLPFAAVLPADTFADADASDTLLALTLRRVDGTALPAWLTFDPLARTLLGTPHNADVGPLALVLVATDTAGATASDTFTVTVHNTNDPPLVGAPLPDRAATEGVPFAWPLPLAAFSDPDAGDTLTFSAAGPGGAPLPAWLAFDPDNLVFHGAAPNAAVGAHLVVVTARDAAAAAVSASFTVRVDDVNAAPRVATPLDDLTALEDAPFAADFPLSTFTDEDPGDALALAVTAASGAPRPTWLHFDPATRRLSGTPDNAAVGALALALVATDKAGATAVAPFTLTVLNTNDAPRASSPLAPPAATEDLPFTWVLPATAFSDDDLGDTLTFSVAPASGGPLPAWLTFHPSSRLLLGTPQNADVGDLPLLVTATDAAGATATAAATLAVVNTNDAPRLVAPLDPATALEDTPFTWALPSGTLVDDDAGDTLAFSAARADGAPLPAWLTFDPAARTLSGTPRNEHVGPLLLTLRAVDLAGATATATLALSVVNTNDAPLLLAPLPDRAVTAGSGFAFFIPPSAFADPDVGDSLTFHVTLDGEDGLPAWITFDPAERVFFGSADDADVGIYDLRVTATDQGGLAVASVFSMSVLPAGAGDLRVAAGVADATASEDAPWALTLAADVFTGGVAPIALAARLSGGAPLPPWLGFDPAQGAFFGTATNADVGVHAVEIVATDAAGASAAATFLLTVLNTPDPPAATASLPAATATVGLTFALPLPAGLFTDPDPGDTLALSAARADGGPLPAWLALYPANALLLGTPGALYVGAVDLRLTATDRDGLTAHVDLLLTVAPVAPPAAAPGDLRPPRVLAHEPPDGGALGAAEAVTLRFDEAVDPATVTTTSCAVVDLALDPVAGAWTEAAGAWVFSPDVPFAPGTYTVFVGAGVRDLAGRPLDESGPEDDFSFTVSPGFASPAWRAAPAVADAAVLDVAAAAAEGGAATALWLERRAPNLLVLRSLADAWSAPAASPEGGAEAARAVGVEGRIVAMQHGVAGAFQAVWVVDDRLLVTQCSAAAACATTVLGHAGGGRAGDAVLGYAPREEGAVAAWWDAPGAAGGAGLRVRRAVGAGWAATETVDLGRASAGASLVSAGEAVAAVWLEADAVRWRALRDDGAWAPAERVAAAAVVPALGWAAAASEDGGGLVAWAAQDGAGGAWRVHAAWRTPAGWQLSARAATPGQAGSAPGVLAVGRDASGLGYLAWPQASAAGLRVLVDRFDGAAWRGPLSLDPSGGAAADAAPLTPPVLVGAGAGDGRAVLLAGYGAAAVGGPQLAAVELALESGAVSLRAPALVGPFAATGATGPFSLGTVAVVSDGQGGVGFASPQGVGAARFGEAWAGASVRDVLWGAPLVEGAPEDEDLARAALALGPSGPRALVAVTGEAAARVVAGGLGAELGARRELARVAAASDALLGAGAQALAVAAGPAGEPVIVRRATGALFAGAGACGAAAEPVAIVGFGGPGSAHGATAHAVAWPVEAWGAGCAAAPGAVTGQALAVDGAGRAFVAWSLAGAADGARVRAVLVDPAQGELGSRRSLATGATATPAEEDAVRAAAAGAVAAVLVPDPLAAAVQPGARAIGVWEGVGALDAEVWTDTAALWPDAARVEGSSAAVAVAADGAVLVVAGVSDAQGAVRGRLARRSSGGAWVSTVLTLSAGGPDAAPLPEVRALPAGGARVWLAAAAGAPAIEAWDVGAGGGAALVGRVAPAAAVVSGLVIASRADGAAALAWVEADAPGGAPRLGVALMSAAGVWSAPSVVADTGGLALDGAAVGLDGEGAALVVWREARADGSHAVRWAPASLASPTPGTAREVAFDAPGFDAALPLGLTGAPWGLAVRSSGGAAPRWTCF